MLWDTLSTSWRVCLQEAWAAYCAGSVPIGACITDADDHMVACGRNRIFEPPSGDGYLAGNRMAHAEMNALLALHTWQGDNPMSYTLYTTMEPCPMCMGAIRMAHVGRVCYAARDALAGAASLVNVEPYIELGRRTGPIEIVGPTNTDLEWVILAIQAERLLRNARSRWADLVETLEPTCVPGIQLGRALFASGELGRLRDEGALAEEVVNALADQLHENGE